MSLTCRIWRCKWYQEMSVSWVLAGWVASDQSSCGVVNARGSWRWRQGCHVVISKGTHFCSVTDINVSLLVHCLVSMTSWELASVQMPSRGLPIESEVAMNTPFWLAQPISPLFSLFPVTTQQLNNTFCNTREEGSGYIFVPVRTK
jgi:hypothetical protein